MEANERTGLIQDSTSHGSTRWRKSLSNHLSSSLSAQPIYSPLAFQCYIAGFADAISYTSTKTWVGFMTGNLTQLSISVSNIIFSISSNEEYQSSLARIEMSSFSILGFILGCLVSSGLTSLYGNARGKLVFSSIFRAMITCLVLFRGLLDDSLSLKSSPMALGLLSLTMGWQAVTALKLPSTPYSSTVVFTTSLSQLVSDPFSFNGRHRAISIFALVLGGFSSQTIMLLTRKLKLDSEANEIAVALGALATLEVFLSLTWFLTRDQEDEDGRQEVINHH